MNALNLSVLSLFLSGSALAADPPATVAPDSADPLAEALPILQTKYVDFQALDYKPGDKLSDLIARSHGEISLVAPDSASEPVPILTSTLPDNIIYWRLASFTPKKDWGELGTELQDASARYPHGGAVLDLRGNDGHGDIAGAAQVIHYFAPGDDSLVKFRPMTSKGSRDGGSVIPDHPFHGPLIVLINHQTGGEAQLLAARLKADGALLVGRETAGKGAVFEEQKLSSGNVLRYVAAHVNLADGADLWNHPVIPDISPTVDNQAEKGALILIAHNRILDVIQESAGRHRMNEAALVQGEDPEWDEYLATLEKKPDASYMTLPPIHDIVLTTALDSLKAIRLSQEWALAPSQAQAENTPAASTSLQ